MILNMPHLHSTAWLDSLVKSPQCCQSGIGQFRSGHELHGVTAWRAQALSGCQKHREARESIAQHTLYSFSPCLSSAGHRGRQQIVQKGNHFCCHGVGYMATDKCPNWICSAKNNVLPGLNLVTPVLWKFIN